MKNLSKSHTDVAKIDNDKTKHSDKLPPSGQYPNNHHPTGHLLSGPHLGNHVRTSVSDLAQLNLIRRAVASEVCLHASILSLLC